jgi:hypothetical protein
MLIKNPLRVLLMLIVSLLSVNANAQVKYPASDFQPKIVYQSEEVKKIAQPPKPQTSEPPVAPLLMVLLLAGAAYYGYKAKFQNLKTASKKVTVRPVAIAIEPLPAVDTESNEQSEEAPVKQINRNYKGYRSPRFSEES